MYKQARDAIEALYAKAKLGDAADLFVMPGGNQMTWPELLASLQELKIVTGTPTNPLFDAYTDVNGATNIIYIDPGKFGDDVAVFGQIKGYNFTIYHELAHAVRDGEAGWNHPNREQIANKHGQMLAQFVGASYPNDSELIASAGGTWTYN